MRRQGFADQFAESSTYPVVLSAARKSPASRDERESKDPEAFVPLWSSSGCFDLPLLTRCAGFVRASLNTKVQSAFLPNDAGALSLAGSNFRA
jgi:hypothetical protein